MPGSGIFATIGYASESSWGTFTAPTHFITAQSEAGEYVKGVTTAHTLHGGFYDLSGRRAVTKIGAKQALNLDVFDRSMGLLWKACIGSGTVSGTGPYTQVITPAPQDGTGLSIQVGRPSTNDTTLVTASYTGCKVTEWSMATKAGELASFDVTFDSKFEDLTQSYTAPSYTTGNVLTGIEASLVLGGTVSTTSGVTSVSGGTTVTLARDVSIKATNPLDVNRYFLGSATKGEQLADNFRQVTGTVTLDFTALSTIYSAGFTADAPFALQLNITGPVIQSGTHSAVNVLLPCCFWDTDSFPVKGPQIIQETANFTAYDDGLGDNPVQVVLTTLDAAL